MKKIIDIVTVTGANDFTKIGQMITIAKEYPFVEFGILLSKQQAGTHRFPSVQWLKDMTGIFVQAKDNPLRLSGHICGQWVREIMRGYWPTDDFNAIHPAFDKAGLFSRWQLNTHAQGHMADSHKLSHLLSARAMENQTIIFQHDGVNDGISAAMKAWGNTNIAALFDLSHGAGILTAVWPKPLSIDCGYAGGLRPDNVAAQLATLEKVVGDAPVRISIDAETWLRSDDDRLFDLKRVRAFLEAAKPWVK